MHVLLLLLALHRHHGWQQPNNPHRGIINRWHGPTPPSQVILNPHQPTPPSQIIVRYHPPFPG